jgi:hypothetical protein
MILTTQFPSRKHTSAPDDPTRSSTFLFAMTNLLSLHVVPPDHTAVLFSAMHHNRNITQDGQGPPAAVVSAASGDETAQTAADSRSSSGFAGTGAQE